MKKIDIHCHILPGLDDGSGSLRESIRMLRMAAKQGIYTVIATPHYSVDFENCDPERIRDFCRNLEAAAREQIHPDFRIYPGQEIFYSNRAVELLIHGRLLTLAETNYILVEFLPNVPYSYLYKAVNELVLAGYTPILAHVERYGVLRKPGRLEELVSMGAQMQINYRSVGRPWYQETTRWCRKMLKNQSIQFLGTDMHNSNTRRPQTQEAELWMAKHLDMKYIIDLCRGNAQKIIGGRTIEKKEGNHWKYA